MTTVSLDDGVDDKPPHLMVIGAQKAGTTWLQHILDCNARFWCPPHDQEVHFFDRHYERGLDYYFGLYDAAPSDAITCDVTPDYLSEPSAPERLAHMAERIGRRVRFVLLCREPVARVISAYKMKVRQGATCGLREALEALPDLISNSRYHTHLQRYFTHFQPEQFLILIQEEFLSDAQGAALVPLSRFLSLDGLSNPYEGLRVNAGGHRRYPLLDKLLMLGARPLRHLGMTGALHAVKTSPPVALLKQLNQTPFELSEDDQAVQQALKEHFRDEVTALARLIDRPGLPEFWGYSPED